MGIRLKEIKVNLTDLVINSQCPAELSMESRLKIIDNAINMFLIPTQYVNNKDSTNDAFVIIDLSDDDLWNMYDIFCNDLCMMEIPELDIDDYVFNQDFEGYLENIFKNISNLLMSFKSVDITEDREINLRETTLIKNYSRCDRFIQFDVYIGRTQ